MSNRVFKTTHQMGPYPKALIFLILGVFPMFGFALVLSSVVASYLSISNDGYPIASGLLLLTVGGGTGLVLIVIGWKFIMAGMATYLFTKEGIYAHYPFKAKQFIPWNSFQEICVCYGAYTTRGKQKANSVICCIKYGEKKNSYGRWKANLFRYRSVICIDYSTELLNGIREVCPYEVIDLRETPAYKLYYK